MSFSACIVGAGRLVVDLSYCLVELLPRQTQRFRFVAEHVLGRLLDTLSDFFDTRAGLSLNLLRLRQEVASEQFAGGFERAVRVPGTGPTQRVVELPRQQRL